MERIPHYLRTTINKYKGLITEKVIVNYLMREGFICEIYLSVAEWRKRDWKDDLRHHKQLYERDLKIYSSELPPEDWDYLSTPTMTWDEYRKDELRHVKALMKDLEHSYLIDMEEEREFEYIWGPHLEQIRKYNEWLREYGHYQPDYIAKKGDKVFLMEVKSSLSGRRALSGEHQRKALLKAYDFGIMPMLLVVPISIGVEIGEPQLQTIEK
ncbi:hypothetical protein MUP00_12485 [Candidatus Bathyarchaeota archaeon]|nr:hypothetical protein [Candidatus Bathyarchaeota archaeon]